MGCLVGNSPVRTGSRTELEQGSCGSFRGCTSWERRLNPDPGHRLSPDPGHTLSLDLPGHPSGKALAAGKPG